METTAKGELSGTTATVAKVLAGVIALGAIAIAATTGVSWAVRTILVLVAADITVRLWRA